tara:strand:+ start:42 stop:650 length:609 start_codon:yes stop_codon:yes gene_type:complete
MTKLTTTTLIELEINQTMKEYKKLKKKNSKDWKNAFEAECHGEAVKFMDEAVKLDETYNKKIKDLEEKLKVAQSQESIVRNAKCISVNVIFTYDHKDQDMIDLIMYKEEFSYHLRNEVAFLKWVIEKSFKDESEAKDLLKISMCVSPQEMSDEEFTKWTGIKEFLARGGKYYFQPNQRDKVEELIIRDTEVASITKPFAEIN